MLERLLTEQPNPHSRDIDALPLDEMLRVMNDEDRKVAESITPEIPQIARAVEGIVERLERGGRLLYIGAGTSGRLGVLDAAECPPTFNVSPHSVLGIIAGGESALSQATEASEDDPELGRRDLFALSFSSPDALVGISASGRTPYVLGAVRQANFMGALSIGISCTPDSELSRTARIPITPLSGPEVIAGSTRLKAGTATKLVLNMLSTCAFIRMGYVYGNLMVNLQPKNEKLRDRARRILSEATGISHEEAGERLVAAGNRVQTALVMILTGVDRKSAERRLEETNGNVRAASNR